MINSQSKSLKNNWLLGIVLIVLAVSCLVPIIHTIALSLSSQSAASSGSVTFWPRDFTLNSYKKLFEESTFFTAFFTSIKRVTLALAISGGLAIITAYALSRDKKTFKGRDIYIWLLIFTMLFNAGTIPWYMTIRNVGLLDTVWALVLPCAINQYNIIVLMNFFRGLPKELDEAANLDGAGPWRILLNVYVPLSLPAIATIMLFVFVYHWNNFFDGLVLMSKPMHYPLATYIYQLSLQVDIRTITDVDTLKELLKVSGTTLNAAKLVVCMIPILVVYPFMQKYFVTGMTLGSVKE